VLIRIQSTPNQDIYFGFMVRNASQCQHILSEYTLFWDQILFCDQQVVPYTKQNHIWLSFVGGFFPQAV